MQFQWLKKIENPLVKPFYKQYLPYSRPNKAEHIAVLKDNRKEGNTIIACARLRPIGELSLLTGMLVSPDYRGQQLGHQLLRDMRPHFENNKTFTFALPHLEHFYRQHDFYPTVQAPNDIQQRFLAYQKQGKTLLLLGFDDSNQADI
ncbi:MAG: GNAT family N-acetyltransferase [Moritella sp.]|uniref:GNAT family N-acetyltransferase n=1 Tax=unclassified Moritella TaxID=2637987 RepID=UPI0001569139|nr:MULTISPECIES: GNAT family N-acetyltransferase [unclassified Moritella]EDM66531.1 Predicted acyltransferase [Moritella sp. PE36]MBL1417856.1 GNAT family N-acetyltransferase [Moritella sp.]